MLKHPRGGVNQKQMKAIMAKLHANKHVGFERMKIYLMNQTNPRTNRYFTQKEAEEVAVSIYQKQIHKKDTTEIMKEKK